MENGKYEDIQCQIQLKTMRRNRNQVFVALLYQITYRKLFDILLNCTVSFIKSHPIKSFTGAVNLSVYHLLVMICDKQIQPISHVLVCNFLFDMESNRQSIRFYP
jgi:hypothetical protein